MTTGFTPKVTVAMTAYNHAAYVECAIRSALAQRTLFDVEIVVGDDASSDETRDIISRLAAHYPGRIRAVLPPENLGQNGNVLFGEVLNAARGEYIALLDGDDYWLSTNKLQAQADVLDRNTHLSMCFHDAHVENAQGIRCDQRYTGAASAATFHMEDLLRENPIATCSAMLRVSCVMPLSSWVVSSPFADWALYLAASLQGPIGYLPDAFGVYRYHGKGIWSSLTKREQLTATIRFLQEIRQFLPGSAQSGIAAGLMAQRVALAAEAARSGRRLEAAGMLARAAVTSPRGLYRERQRLARATPAISGSAHD